MQNSLSLLQAQDGMFKVIGDILNRSSELKIKFDSPVANSAEKEAYSNEFIELQGELRSIAQSKWNGVSLFFHSKFQDFIWSFGGYGRIVARVQ